MKKKLKRPLRAGDMIVTNFWGVDEVCKVYRTEGEQVTIIRLESIVHHKDVMGDYCQAVIDEDLIGQFPYQFLHESKWYLVQ